MESHGSKDSITVGLDRRTPLNDLGTGTKVGVDRHYKSFMDRFTDAYVNEMHAFVDYALGRTRRPVAVEEIG